MLQIFNSRCLYLVFFLVNTNINEQNLSHVVLLIFGNSNLRLVKIALYLSLSSHIKYIVKLCGILMKLNEHIF